MKKVYFILTRIVLFSIIFSIPLAFYGQDEGDSKKEEKKNMNSSFSPYWYFQGDIGPSFSHADLSDYGFLPDFKHVSFNGQLGFGRQLTRVWSIYLNAERGFFNGEKANVIPKNINPANTSRDFKFDNDYYGGNFNVGINLSNWWGGYKDRLVSFGIHAGVGQVQWKSKTYDMANNDKVVKSFGYANSPDKYKGGGINGRIK